MRVAFKCERYPCSKADAGSAVVAGFGGSIHYTCEEKAPLVAVHVLHTSLEAVSSDS